jgi:hypothetical protein
LVRFAYIGSQDFYGGAMHGCGLVGALHERAVNRFGFGFGFGGLVQ